MKPSVFIASSVENLHVARALHEELEFVAEVTVWNQGVFELSKYSLESLKEVLDSSDFGIFVFTPDDVVSIRGAAQGAVRDNVLFELGMFIGRLGRDRNFIVMPRNMEQEFHLPTDIIGITCGVYEPNRKDGKLRAALGPVSSQISRRIAELGSLSTVNSLQIDDPIPIYSDGDKKAILESWMSNRDARLNTKVIHFRDVDKELRLPAGTTKILIKQVASRWNYVVQHEGDSTILFRKISVAIGPRSSSYRDW